MTTPINGSIKSVVQAAPQPVAVQPAEQKPADSKLRLPGSGQPADAAANGSLPKPDAEAGKPALEEPADIRAVVEELRAQVRNVRRELDFRVDEESGRTIITVLNAETGEVVRQIPPEETLQLMQDIPRGGARLINNRA